MKNFMIKLSDKQLHFIAGVLLFIFYMFVSSGNINNSIIFVLLCGLGKELIDEYIRSTGFDFRDWMATTAGGAVSALIYIFMKG